MSFTIIFYSAMLRSRVEPYFPSKILGQLFSLRKNIYSLLYFKLKHLSILTLHSFPQHHMCHHEYLGLNLTQNQLNLCYFSARMCVVN